MIRLATVLAIAATAAGAGTPLLPPAEYDHPYAGTVDLYLVDGSNTWAECRRYGGMKGIPFKVGGCAWVAEDGTCVVFVAMRSKRAPVEDIIRHEVAHCNGWPADHPM
jgi:hypothetical protein